MIKYVSNAFLATKIAFINEMAELCEKVGANVLEVASAMGKDGRISPKFLHPGPGYGGSCFPKDTKAIYDTAKQNGVNLSIIGNAISSNEYQKKRSAQKIINKVSAGDIGILGLAFKPDTDDVRESPAIEIVKQLSKNGNYTIKVFDPKAMKEAKTALEGYNNIIWCENEYDVCEGSDALAITTEWLEFRGIDLLKVKKIMKGNCLFDFRNIFTKEEVEEIGFEYFGTGI